MGRIMFLLEVTRARQLQGSRRAGSYIKQGMSNSLDHDVGLLGDGRHFELSLQEAARGRCKCEIESWVESSG
jgi:hypothetical protein